MKFELPNEEVVKKMGLFEFWFVHFPTTLIQIIILTWIGRFLVSVFIIGGIGMWYGYGLTKYPYRDPSTLSSQDYQKFQEYNMKLNQIDHEIKKVADVYRWNRSPSAYQQLKTLQDKKSTISFKRSGILKKADFKSWQYKVAQFINPRTIQRQEDHFMYYPKVVKNRFNRIESGKSTVKKEFPTFQKLVEIENKKRNQN